MNIIKRLIYKITGHTSIEDNTLYKQMQVDIQNTNSPKEMGSFEQSHCDIRDKFDDIFYKKINEEGTVRVNKNDDLKYLNFSKLIGKAFIQKEWDPILNILDENVILTLYNNKEIVGKTKVIEYWQNWEMRYNEPYCGTKYTVKFCKYFSRTALLISPLDSKSMYIVARFEKEYVKNILFVETPLQNSMIRYWDLDHEALSFENCPALYTGLGNDMEAKQFRIPCMTCGCKSEKMQWYEFELRRGPLTYVGELSLCPECMKFVEYRPTIMFRN